jgi:ATP-dependent Lon protease
LKRKKTPIKPLVLKKKSDEKKSKSSIKNRGNDAGNDQGLNKPPVSPLQVHHDAADLIDEANQNLDGAEKNIPTTIPVLPVRDIVVFNYMILPLFVGREKSVGAVEAAMTASRHILVLTQKDEATENPEHGDLYRTGTVCMIMRMLKMPDGRLKVLVQGLSRARVKNFIASDPFPAEHHHLHHGHKYH